MKASTQAQRLTLFAHHLQELLNAPPGSALVFEIPGQPLAYVQFERTPEGLKGEVCSGDWGPRKKAHPLPPAALNRLRAMGWQIPQHLREHNPTKIFAEENPHTIAMEIEKIFREIFLCPPNYTVRTEGVLRNPGTTRPEEP